MQSRIDALLTPQERLILSMYADSSNHGIGQAVQHSLQYAVGAGLFVVLCLWFREPLWVLPVYGTFLAFMFLRLFGGQKLSGVMPAILQKYEARIAELEQAAESPP